MKQFYKRNFLVKINKEGLLICEDDGDEFDRDFYLFVTATNEILKMHDLQVRDFFKRYVR